MIKMDTRLVKNAFYIIRIIKFTQPEIRALFNFFTFDHSSETNHQVNIRFGFQI